MKAEVANRELQGSLAKWVDSLQARGRYAWTKSEAADLLRVSSDTLRKAIQRLIAKRRIAAVRRGFYVIVPLEYRESGAPPASWFIDDLMKFHGTPYYVGLLSAAALFGAGHQQPQEFQGVTSAQLRPAECGRNRLRFFTKRIVERTPAVEIKTETGMMRVSSPEATAHDLVRYLGSLDVAATVLAELAERLDAERLAEVARIEGDLPNAQRLGFLLDLIGAKDRADALASVVGRRRPRFVPLRSGRSIRKASRNDRWRVFVNEQVEAET